MIEGVQTLYNNPDIREVEDAQDFFNIARGIAIQQLETTKTCSESGLSDITYELQDNSASPVADLLTNDPETMLVNVDTSNIEIDATSVYSYTLKAYYGNTEKTKHIQIKMVECLIEK